MRLNPKFFLLLSMIQSGCTSKNAHETKTNSRELRPSPIQNEETGLLARGPGFEVKVPDGFTVFSGNPGPDPVVLLVGAETNGAKAAILLTPLPEHLSQAGFDPTNPEQCQKVGEDEAEANGIKITSAKIIAMDFGKTCEITFRDANSVWARILILHKDGQKVLVNCSAHDDDKLTRSACEQAVRSTTLLGSVKIERPNARPGSPANLEVEKIADEACDCHDKQCADRVVEKLKSWLIDNPTPTGDKQRGVQSGRRTGVCLEAAGLDTAELQQRLQKHRIIWQP